MQARRIALFLLAALFAAVGARTARAERVKDLATFEGARSNQLTGYGVVVGLAGTGDGDLEYALQAVRSAATRLGANVPANPRPSLKNAAAVLVTADLPPFAKPGQTIDVTVSAIGKAKSLRGGTLILTRLAGADGQTYALAQGNLAVGGLGVEGRDGSKVVINVPSAGRIPDGATVERPAPATLGSAAAITLLLRRADFTDATRIAAAINRSLGRPAATPRDPSAVDVAAPPDPAQRMDLMAKLEAVEVSPDAAAARVVVNARTGTIVISGAVRVAPAAVAHGSLIVRIDEKPEVSQPFPLSGGRTQTVQRSTVSVEQEPVRAFVFAPGVALPDIVAAINRVGAAPADLVAILEALKQAGALKAELVIL
jgi:flagellar P-ring protein precursor FlgI